MINFTLLTDDFTDALLSMNRTKAAKILNECYTEYSDYFVLEKIISDSLNRIGDDWEEGSTSLAQIYMSGVICEELIERFFPQAKNDKKDFPRLAIAVLHDHHALGKRIVSSIVRANGYEILDFGQGLTVEELIELTIENDIKILLISTLMLPSALKVKTLTEKLNQMGSAVKVIVGGAPFRFDSQLWEKVGAVADGKNATDIVAILEKVVDRKHG